MLSVLKKSRKLPVPGSVFRCQEGVFEAYGVVYRNDVRRFQANDLLLVLIYEVGSVGELEEALASGMPVVPPMIVSKLMWSRGFFETVGEIAVDNTVPPIFLAEDPYPGSRGPRRYWTVEDEIAKVVPEDAVIGFNGVMTERGVSEEICLAKKICNRFSKDP